MIFGYARVSTQEQNLDMQIDALHQYGVDEIVQEKISGTKGSSREGLDSLLDKLRADDTLVVWDLKRLGRTVKQLVNLAEDFEKQGIQFVSIKENFDTTNPMGKFVFYIFCAMAQMERDIIAERTKDGLKAARSRGRKGGKKPADDKIVQRAVKMYYSNKFSIREISEATGLSKTTIYKYAKHRPPKEIIQSTM